VRDKNRTSEVERNQTRKGAVAELAQAYRTIQFSLEHCSLINK
jgi:hypothetical protein